MKKLAFATAIAALTTSAAIAEEWVPDPTHTDVVVTWNHAGFSLQTAKFHEAGGMLEFTPGDVENAKANFFVRADSIDTGLPDFDAELAGPAFLNAAEHPEITFVSTSVEQTGDMSVRATGDMTMAGNTAPVTFDITVHALGEHPVGRFIEYNSGEWLGMTATATIKRSDFGVDRFIPVGSDELTLEINTEMRAGGLVGG